MTGRMCHFAVVYSFFALRYNTIAEFNVDYKAECGQLNLAHATRSVKADQKEPGRLWRKGFVKQINFKSRVKDRGSDRW